MVSGPEAFLVSLSSFCINLKSLVSIFLPQTTKSYINNYKIDVLERPVNPSYNLDLRRHQGDH